MEVRRVVAADGVWDVALGIVFLVAALPAGAAALGPAVPHPWPVVVVLVAVGLGSLGYAVVLARASRRDGTAAAVCGPTAVANGIGAAVLVVLLVLLWPAVTAVGAGVIAVAATGCAAFAGAEWVLRG